MTVEKVKLTDFTEDELKVIAFALGFTLQTAVTLTPQDIEYIETFRVQCINAASQRKREEKILMN